MVLNTSAVGDLLCAFAVCNGGNASCRGEKTEGGKDVPVTRAWVCAFFIAKYQATLMCAYEIGHLGSLSYQFTGLSYLCLTFAISHPSTQGRSNTLPSYTLLITILIANRY